MPFFTIQQTIQTVDNVAANYATNTLHFEADNVSDLTAVMTAVATMYQSLNTRFGPLVRQTGHTWKAYNQVDPIPRAPVASGTWSFASPPAGVPLPPEVALCISYQGSRISGVPQARRRGRIYIPFLNVAQVGSDGRPLAATVTAFAAAGQGLLTASDAAGTWAWTTLSGVAPGVATVTDGWVDNEFDTQRRRGRPATSRTTFT
jgi:hypothetical protein